VGVLAIVACALSVTVACGRIGFEVSGAPGTDTLACRNCPAGRTIRDGGTDGRDADAPRDGEALRDGGTDGRDRGTADAGCSGDPIGCGGEACGDGVRASHEGCDDGNTMPFDGCSASCQLEPDCSSGTCMTVCGDGLVIGEACDDGNRIDGDGCSSDCELEPGFMCAQASGCDGPGGACVLRIPAVFRDFTHDHPDFQVDCDAVVTGLLEPMLSTASKPVLAGSGTGACIQGPTTFSEWYTDGVGRAPILGELVLFDNGAGGFVNRYGEQGEQWEAPEMYNNIVYGGPGGTGCQACVPSAIGTCLDPCTPWNNDQACCAESDGGSVHDGNPLFFPIDEAPNALPDTRYRAKIPEAYGYPSWPWEDSVISNAGTHNFHFTTEGVLWFRYEADTSARVEVTGDDDVWVFINRRLAIDLGGVHVPSVGTVALDATTAPDFALTPGNLYELRVFHAERKIEGSTLRLTVTGLDMDPDARCRTVPVL